MNYDHQMIKRTVNKELLESCAEYPVVTVFGPRQSGKTTLVQNTFPDKPYFLLEDPDTRLAAEMDPQSFLRTSKNVWLNHLKFILLTQDLQLSFLASERQNRL